MPKVQFNLLPDVKIAFDQARKIQQKVLSIATVVTSVIMGIFVLTFASTNLLQHQLLNNADKDIANYSAQLKNVPDLEKILTVQNQLAALPSLQQRKHIMSRVFDYLPSLLPPNAGISKLAVDNTTNSLNITGSADTVEIVNTFVDTLKFTTFSTAANKNAKTPAFTTVVLASVNRDAKNANFTINTTFNPQLFDGSQSLTLNVPQQLTTRSITDAPTYFNGQTTPNPTTGGR